MRVQHARTSARAHERTLECYHVASTHTRSLLHASTNARARMHLHACTCIYLLVCSMHRRLHACMSICTRIHACTSAPTHAPIVQAHACTHAHSIGSCWPHTKGACRCGLRQKGRRSVFLNKQNCGWHNHEVLLLDCLTATPGTGPNWVFWKPGRPQFSPSRCVRVWGV